MGIIETSKLNIGYNKITILKDINLEVEAGEIVTLIGPNGSGKTTMLKSIAYILEKISGAIYLSGQDISRLSNRDRARLMSVMLTEKKSYDYITCQDVVRVGRFPYTGVIGKLSKEDEDIVTDVMKTNGLLDLADRDFDKLSDGQRQRVLLARALVQEPKIMLLDEPTSFLDVGYKLEFMAVLKKMCRERQIGILMSLHELDLAAAVSDRIVTITSEGKIDKQGKPGEILTDDYISQLFNIRFGSFSLEGGFKL